jgi:TonB-linked SusC/RagA family outer membrane protein
MKKNNTAFSNAGAVPFLNFLRIMKITIAIMLITCLQVSAKGWTQEKITLKLNAVEIKKALFAIEKKSDYRFLFAEEVLKNKPRISVDVVDATINEVLDKIFQNLDLAYKILSSKLVVLKNANENIISDLKDIRVSGKVTGANGEPLAGVSVLVKGSRLGTTTDASGNFTISVPDNAVLVFSFVGYEPSEVTVGGKTTINLSLKQSEKVQDAVVVIGYGTASKRDLTGSIVKIAGKDIADRPNTNPVASLQSKVPGLYVVNNGTPGQEPDIRIRGTVSIGQVHPLYVVDGILQDNIDYVNPNDIESIEVLKDPSSLAIFGVKGATGVIAVTTKRAKAGQTTITFNTSYGFKTLVDKIKMADATTFNTLFAEENANNGVPTPDYSGLKDNTDWISAVTRTGHFNNNNLNISGASDNNKFNFGVGYITDEGIIKHERLEKMLANFNDEFKVNKALKIGVNLNISRQHNPYNATGVLDQARKTMPQISSGTKTFTVKDPYGSGNLTENVYSGLDIALQNSGVVNPLLELENTWNKTVDYENRYVGSVYIDLNFLRKFNFHSTWYGDVSNRDQRIYSPLFYAYDPLTGNPFLYNTKTSVSESNGDWKKFQQDYLLNYTNSFGAHNIKVNTGFTTYYFGTFQRYAVSKQGTSPTDLPIPDNKRFWYISNGFGYVNQGDASSVQDEYTTVSEFARVLYNYKNKYYLNASFRDDASSQIPGKNRHQSFWALGGAWEVSREDFMKDQHYIDFLKLKGSIGVLGNQSTYGLASYYPFYPGLKSGTFVPFGTNIVSGALPQYNANPDLKWETVNSSEVGIELTAFKNRFHFEANYFNKVTNNMMTYVDLSSLGLDNKLENGGKIKNWGEELLATWNQELTRDLTLNVGGNITFMKNKVISVAQDLPGGIIIRSFANNGTAEARTQPGFPIGSFFGYELAGLYQSNLDILSSPSASSLGSYRPGDFKFKDINGDGVIDANDRKVIGNPSPDFIYGGNIGLNYKHLSLDIDFGGVYGNEIFRIWGSLESPFQRVNYPAFKIDRWHGPGTSNWDPIISQADRFNYNGSTYNIEDGSYFRIRNLQLAYTFNTKLFILAKAKVKSLRVYGNIQNLKTWKHNYGYTTEFGGDATAFGFDNAGGAIPRVITFGLNVTF